MTRLIDADELKKAFYNHECWNVVIEHIIDNAPTVEKRQKGEWINKEIYDECPFCHAGYMKSILEKTLDIYKMNFCFNCGADMRGDNNG